MAHSVGDTNQRVVTRIILTGFGLVLIILGFATLVAVRDKEIRRNAMISVKNHLTYAQLLNEVQAQEDILSLGLHRIRNYADREEKNARWNDLVRADQTLKQLAGQAANSSQAAEWHRLAEASRRFTEKAATVLKDHDVVDSQSMDELFTLHDAVVKMIHNMIQINIQYWASTDEQMRVELDDLTNQSTIMLSSCFLLAFVFAGSTVMIVRKSIERIEWQRDELNRVSWHMLQTQEDTARRFSHELHDELGQSLAAVRANLTHPSLMQEEQRDDCLHLVDEAIANVRELSQLLRPVILDDFGLEAGLRWLTERFGQRTHIAVIFDCMVAERMNADTETHLFRIAQEALTNIARHSQATAVKVSLLQDEEDLLLCIEDNGVGLPLANQETASSLGIIGIRARARECGGSVRLENAKPHGLCVTTRVPKRLAVTEEPS
jgi:signal transduction histidine kinase